MMMMIGPYYAVQRSARPWRTTRSRTTRRRQQQQQQPPGARTGTAPSCSSCCIISRWRNNKNYWNVVVVAVVVVTWIVNNTSSTTTASAYSLAGKRALVTGSSGGIGKIIAIELAVRHGCHVVVHYHERHQGAIETADAITKHCGSGGGGGGICAGIVQADFRDVTQIHQMVRHIDETIWPITANNDGGWDILVNNAGIVSKLALEDDTDDLTAWHECMAVNLHAPRLLSHLALPRMRRRRQQQQQSKNTKRGGGGGVILNIGSIHSEKSNEYMSAYAASKAALDSLTRTMALEYAPHGIRVNCLAPGVVPVERTWTAFYGNAPPDGNGDDDDTADEQQQHTLQPSAMAESWMAHIPLRTLGTAEQVAQAAIPLLTNDWVTGACWQVDGGMMARCNMPPRPRPLKEGGRI